MPFIEGKHVSLAVWHAAQPARPQHTSTLDGDPPAIESPTVGQSAQAVGARKPTRKKSAAALAATGVVLPDLPEGIELADGETERPPISQANRSNDNSEENAPSEETPSE